MKTGVGHCVETKRLFNPESEVADRFLAAAAAQTRAKRRPTSYGLKEAHSKLQRTRGFGNAASASEARKPRSSTTSYTCLAYAEKFMATKPEP